MLERCEFCELNEEVLRCMSAAVSLVRMRA